MDRLNSKVMDQLKMSLMVHTVCYLEVFVSDPLDSEPQPRCCSRPPNLLLLLVGSLPDSQTISSLCVV